MIFNSDNIAAASNASHPVIGWDNIVTIDNVTATTSDTGFPARNLANPSMRPPWKGAANSPLSVEYLTVTNSLLGTISYIAVAGHNFGSSGATVAPETTTSLSNSPVVWTPAMVDTYTKTFLRFDGVDGSTQIGDSASSRPWTASGLSQISDGALLNETTASSWITTPDSPDFTLGSGNFTIEAWFKTTLPVGAFPTIAGHGNSTFTTASSAWILLLISSGLMRFQFHDGSNIRTIDSTTVFSSLINPGWHHVAATRSGNVFRLFIDGVLESSTTLAITINGSGSVLTVGGIKDYAGLQWGGMIDDFRMRVGYAAYTSNFTPPERGTRIEDDEPLIFRFPPDDYAAVRLRIVPGSEPPLCGVLYAGELLVLERGVTVVTDHTPIPMGRKTRVSSNVAENGQFLGRVMTGSWRETEAAFTYFTHAWYRTYFQPFAIAAQDVPFFFAWAPALHPEDTGYCWVLENPRAEENTVIYRMSVKLKYQGVT